MKTQVILVDRRQYARDGVLSEIEDVTYRTLRKYGINAAELSPSNSAEKVA